MKIAVIGAGPAGITTAYQLSKAIGKGKITEVDLYELSSTVGGLARSFTIWEQRVDLGPHRFFSHDTKVNNLWLEVVGKEYDIVNRQTRIFYKNTFFDYPIKPGNALRGLGIIEAVRCVLSYAWIRVFPLKKEDTFESWVSNRFGKRLYTIFFKTYSEKLWGIKCHDLDSDFASQRIKKMSLYEAIKNALFTGNKKEHKTLVDQFAYPLKGTGYVYESMAEKIISNGGNIHLGIAVEKVITSGRTVKGLELTSGEYKEYDHIVSSMPLSQLVVRLPETPYDIKENAHKLKFRNTILVYLLINKEELFTDQWLYIHSEDLKTGRISNFRNWVPELYGDEKNTILCMEYWYNFDDPEWQSSDESLIQLAKNEIKKTGLIGDAEILNGHVVKLPRCYPVYFKNYKEVLDPIVKYLETIEKLHVIGRYGAYKYNNQDHSILMGLMAAENILDDKNNNLWEINTDYEVYQEASIITKTGLANMKGN
jgi:protoporphyrinogen oxidase